MSLTYLLVNINMSFSQNYQDIVFLKNGEVVKGIITEQVINQHILIRTEIGSLVKYDLEEIQKIEKLINKDKLKGEPININKIPFVGYYYNQKHIHLTPRLLKIAVISNPEAYKYAKKARKYNNWRIGTFGLTSYCLIYGISHYNNYLKVPREAVIIGAVSSILTIKFNINRKTNAKKAVDIYNNDLKANINSKNFPEFNIGLTNSSISLVMNF